MGGILESMFGGSDDDHRDFVRRYDDGPPDTGYDDDEARDRYQRVSRRLSRQDYERSARGAVERMSPQQRRQLARQMRERDPDFDRDYDGRDDRYDDPDYLARRLGGTHERQPDLLGSFLGGGGGGNTIAKMAMGGIAAMAVKSMMDRR
jgi:hypothetical protein